MSEKKCFCHLNGYEVKDATARRIIEEQQTKITALEEQLKNTGTGGSGGSGGLNIYKHSFNIKVYSDAIPNDMTTSNDWTGNGQISFLSTKETAFEYIPTGDTFGTEEYSNGIRDFFFKILANNQENGVWDIHLNDYSNFKMRILMAHSLRHISLVGVNSYEDLLRFTLNPYRKTEISSYIVTKIGV